MKNRILPLILAAFGLVTANAQNFSVEVLDTTLSGPANETDFYGDINLTNNTSSALDMRWERINVALPGLWTTSVCDPQLCHPVSTDSADFSLPVFGIYNYINVHFFPNDVAGSGFIQVKVYELDFPQDYFILTFNGEATSGVGISEATPGSISVFPNPAKEQAGLNINYDFNGAMDIQVANMFGAVMMKKSIDNRYGQVFLDVSYLPNGMYFISFRSDDLEIVRRIIKQN